MTPIKQTVYLPVEEGTSDMSVTYWEECTHVAEVKEVEGYFFTPEQLNEYTADVIEQALEIAAEKANLISLGSEQEVWNSVSTDIKDFVVNKQSITNTFEETFKKFEV
jgi:hypothetical protein